MLGTSPSVMNLAYMPPCWPKPMMPRRTFLPILILHIALHSLEKVLVAHRHEIVIGSLQGLPHAAAVELVLLHQQVLRPAGLRRCDDGREVEVAFAHFGELHHVPKFLLKAREVPGFQHPE